MAVYRDQFWAPPPPPNQRQAQLQNHQTGEMKHMQTTPPAATGEQDEKDEKGKREKRQFQKCQNGTTGHVQTKPATNEEGEKAKQKRQARCQCWLSQNFIMGKLSSFFKKSDDKAKPPNPPVSNPYAVNQPSPSPSSSNYEPFNTQQYDGNRYRSQPSQGFSAGSHHGGLPGKGVAPSSHTSTPQSNQKTSATLPPYTEEPPAPHHAPPSYTSNSSTSTGYPREKFGASGGIGHNRFDHQAGSQHGQPGMYPPQRQGGYGGFDDGRGDLFANHHGPSKQAARPIDTRPGMPFDDSAQNAEMQPMTEEEGVQQTKRQIEQHLGEIKAASGRNRNLADEFRRGAFAVTQKTHEQGQTLYGVEQNAARIGTQVTKGRDNLTNLGNAQKMVNFASNSKSAIQRQGERSMTQDQNLDVQIEKIKRNAKEEDEIFENMQRHIMTSRGQPNRILGGGQANNKSPFQFEDDSGVQGQLIDEADANNEETLQALIEGKEALKAQGQMLEKQNARLDAMTENVSDTLQRLHFKTALIIFVRQIERHGDGLWRNKVHLETKYLRK
ncbi:hypothetical protein N0V88_004666 [Collariella sp. IMI 366227]|nr:hypothetical protein N0V88_004666 [Collariella sp. IMI 366227]